MAIPHQEKILHNLAEFLTSEQISVNETIKELHGRDESYHAMQLPDIVVFPETAEQVSKIMKLSQQYAIPIVPFGLGSSLEGHVIPEQGGITVDFSLMNKVLNVDAEDFLVTVQPGVTRTQLNKELKKYGLFFTVDPGADATLGGMAATNASGTTSVKYGVMRDQVRDLEVVMADGTIIHTGNKAAKSSSGLHLNGLFVGSEGTLGCFTEMTLKVYGIPEFVTAARASFPSVKDAVEAVVSILQAGIPIARVELVDEQSMRQVNEYNDTAYLEKPTLFLEFHGNEAGLKQDVEFMEEIVQGHACEEIAFETDTAARNQLWEARHTLAYAYIHGYPGKKMMVTDVCLPISELAGAVGHARENLQALGLPGGIVGHVGDGNFHALIMMNMEDPEEVARAQEFNGRIVEYALERGGTCTGEHGVGLGKQKYQQQEHGAALEVMEKIKRALDPNNLLNPGKNINVETKETIK
ncbi:MULTISPECIES: FAD-binding oxidoreductase [unclassified Planococcus (in: firmicutes)]|uniref:FAD-binding oxidoreductase n=1 Tax=unclassified Planococcus (in: firmicutes) TaxID=2662419 RepID=UPI000C3257CC|nr:MULTISPECIES: FAD-linked oxidase C-terminal domain-containing protein [unclassified Planococcus (in: firmicutes)]AUD13160.1 2-hydroxy-acid oxidase [Planococcus sp. MB-3u-03]PKG45356.1 2-hydroxy-acid oxidase [Planococcus sp. Urea-trap-24]PKG89048.1 2-hydroxy-acid oxidase [Planococcus sp. Urea-3u-39]PKH39363.1 2-hydroxy-acid oxidase [Planococcus sp. MB-3u-09]